MALGVRAPLGQKGRAGDGNGAGPLGFGSRIGATMHALPNGAVVRAAGMNSFTSFFTQNKSERIKAANLHSSGKTSPY